MALHYGVQFVAQFTAWDTNANAAKTGDAANFTLRWIKDGVDSGAAPTNNPATELGATNTPGEYNITITATEAQCLTGTICGKSSTVNVAIIPKTYAFLRLPNVAPNANGGLPLVDGNLNVAADIKYIGGSVVQGAAARANNYFGVNSVNIGGTAQTGRDLGASVLLSAGTGTGQLDFTSGVVKSNIVQILGTALTETAGQIAAGFKKFFNVAAPVMDVTSVNQTGDAYAKTPDSAHYTNARGDLLDNLDAAVSTRSTVAGIFSRQFGANYGSKTFEQLICIILSVVGGPSSGAGTATETFKSPVNGITAAQITNDGTNRTGTTLGSPQ